MPRLRDVIAGVLLVGSLVLSVPLLLGASAAAGLLSLMVVALPGGFLRGALMVLPFFSRITPAKALESPARARIVALLTERPGLGITDVCAALGIGWGTAVHHLNLLERAGHVASRDAGRHRRFFVAAQSAELRTAVCVLSNDLSRRVLLTIHARPRVSQTQLCDELGLSPPLAHKAIGRLRRDGLVTAVREWRTVRYSVAPAGTAVVRAAQESPPVQGIEGPMVLA